jgi:hypothetical protein
VTTASFTQFAIVGDMQETSHLEFWRESNEAARSELIRQLHEAGHPLVVMLGDMVFDGSSHAHWVRFDAAIAPLRNAGRMLVPVIGNHEYWSMPLLGPSDRTQRLRYFEERFPGSLDAPCRVVRVGQIALVILDSNIEWFSPQDWRAKLESYQALLDELDLDPTVCGVLVLSHHPPYTNSRLTSDELHVQRDFVPPFSRAKKTLAMLSGHVHTYERFQKGAKTFIVSGGGGGPRVERHEGRKRRHEEAFVSSDGGKVRPLHYLHCELDHPGLKIEVRGVDGSILDRFMLHYPK